MFLTTVIFIKPYRLTSSIFRKTIIENEYACHRTFDSNFCSWSSEADEPKVPRKRNKQKIAMLIAQYLESLQQNELYSVNNIPETFLCARRNSADYCFAINEAVARDIIYTIANELLTGRKTVIEGNPGIGLFTKYLLEVGVPKLRVLDTLHSSTSPFHKLANENADKIETIHKCNIFHMKRPLYDGEGIEKMFAGLPHQDWEDEPSIALVGVILMPSYLRYLMKSVVFPSKLTQYGRIDHFLVVSSYVYNGIISGRRGSLTRIFTYSLWNILMDCKLLGKFDRKAFLPWGTLTVNDKENESLYLVRITQKRDLFQKLTQQQWTSFWIFLRSVGKSKSNRILPLLEKWIPGCGPVFINKGLTVSMEAQDLEYEEMLTLFKIFISLPEYDHIKFLHGIESSFDELKEADINK